jgi:hypothetical protein
MLKISEIPLSVLNRALELLHQDQNDTPARALDALLSAESRIDRSGQYTAFAQALAEYISMRGPWADGEEYEGECGYEMRL